MTYEPLISSDEQTASSNVVLFPGDVQYPHVPTVPSIPSADALPAGYRALADGIYYLEQDDLGDERPVRLCSTVAVIGLCRRSDSKGWGRVVDVVDPDHRTHRVVLDEPLFNGAPAALLRPLLDSGLQIEKGANVKKRLVELLGAWRPGQVFVRVSRVGWVDDDFDTFALADGSIIGSKASIFETCRDEDRVDGASSKYQQTIVAVPGCAIFIGVSADYQLPTKSCSFTDGQDDHENPLVVDEDYLASAGTGRNLALLCFGNKVASRSEGETCRCTAGCGINLRSPFRSSGPSAEPAVSVH